MAVFDSNMDLKGVANAAKKVAEDAVVRFGRDGAGVVVGLPRGDYILTRRVIEPKWADGQALVVGYLRPS